MKDYKKNHIKAWCHFVATGKIPADAKKNEWCLHHTDTALKYTDIDRYNEWRVEDLVPMLRKDHTALHQKNRRCADATKAKISAALKGHEVPEETREKISEKCRGLHNGREFRKGDEPWNKGMKMSEEFCRKASDRNKGRVHSAETREKMSKSHLGRRMSEEAKAKISAALKGHEVPEETREKISEKCRGRRLAHSKEHNERIGSWKRGKIWVNNGSVMKMVDKDGIPAGFEKGRLK